MTHTQGPLSVHPYTTPPWQEVGAGAGHGAFRSASIGIGAGRTLVAQVRAQTPSEGFPEVDNEAELVANAALFIAAPDLLDSLLTMRDYVADVSTGFLTYEASGEGLIEMAKGDLARLDAAITKARDTNSVQAALDALRPATPSISKEGE